MFKKSRNFMTQALLHLYRIPADGNPSHANIAKTSDLITNRMPLKHNFNRPEAPVSQAKNAVTGGGHRVSFPRRLLLKYKAHSSIG
ncbi:MAG: hypothetical protein HKN85_06590 [Gammaproteobacteria bacterium]|nr:hypothetical protein [Gammaproteobacteria bacterium]